MIEIKPDFYDRFTCIADKCSFTCCQEWKIAVDKDTKNKWKSVEALTDCGVECADKKSLADCIVDKDGADVIGLNDDMKCPFLNDEKLCKLVIKHGDTILSKTCASFPRQMREFHAEEDGTLVRKEYALVSCCPEVIDFLNQKEKIQFVGMEKGDFYFQIRNFMIELIQDTSRSTEMSMLLIFYVLQELEREEKKISVIKNLSEKKRQQKLMEKLQQWEKSESIKELENAVSGMDFSIFNQFEETNELFLDLAENYRKEKIYVRHLEKIATVAEQISDDLMDGKNEKNLVEKQSQIEREVQEFKKTFSQYERLFRNYLVAEIFTNGLMPDADVENMAVMFQWIAMEYAIMKHVIFLNWKLSEKNEISYETVRDCMVVIARMTGYDEEDIYEYLENSFENLVWDWGYFALITGK